MNMKYGESSTLQTALDLVAGFSIFKDNEFLDTLVGLKDEIDRYFKGKDHVQVLHTGSGYEGLFLPHVTSGSLNTDCDHMVILTNFTVMESVCDNPNTDPAPPDDKGNLSNFTVVESAGSQTNTDPVPPDEKGNLSNLTVVEGVCSQLNNHQNTPDEKGMGNLSVFYMRKGSHAGYVLLSSASGNTDVHYCLQTSKFLKDADQKYDGEMSLSFQSETKITGPSHQSDLSVNIDLKIDRDLVYSLECKQWPNQALEWKDRNRDCDWPNPEIVDFIISSGCHLVPVSSHGSLYGDCEWRLSFSLAELQLIETMPEHIKVSYTILKTIIKIEMKKQNSEMFASYHLKTTLFWLLEETGMNEFKDMNMLQIVLFLLERFLLFYKSSNMPNYFVRTNNMIDHRASDEIKNAVQVLEYIKTNLTSIICKYIDEYQTPLISFDQTFTQALQSDDVTELYRLCKYNFVLIAMAKFLLTSKEEILVRLKDDSSKKWCVRYLAKATALHTLTPDQNPSTQQQPLISNFDSGSLDFKTFSKLLQTLTIGDELSNHDNTCVLFATLNVFLTTLPDVSDNGFQKEETARVSPYVCNTSFKEMFFWLLDFSEERCSALHHFVTANWDDKPNFMTSDATSQQLARLLTVTLAKPTKQSKLVNGTLIRNTTEKSIGSLMTDLYEYLLVNNLYSSAFVALQVRAYYSDETILWWATMSLKYLPHKEIKRGILKMMLSEEFFKDQLSLEAKKNYEEMLLQ